MQIQLEFGRIVINGVEYREDVVLCGENIVPRPKHLSKHKAKLYGHTPLTREEMEHIVALCRDFDAIFIGKGMEGALPIENDVLEFLRQLSKPIYIDTSPKIVEMLRGFGGRVLAVIHITC